MILSCSFDVDHVGASSGGRTPLDGYPGLEHSLPIAPFYSDVVDVFAATMMTYTPTLLVSYGGPWAENYFYSRENPHDDPKLQYFTAHGELDQKSRRRPAGFRDDEHVFQRHSEGVRAIVEAGGRAGVGSHGQLQGLGYHWELWAMAAADVDEHGMVEEDDRTESGEVRMQVWIAPAARAQLQARWKRRIDMK